MSRSIVTKEPPMERYEIKNEHGDFEATIAIRGWTEVGIRGDTHEHGKIIISSAYGSYSTYFGSMGKPLKQFLLGVDLHYILNRLEPASMYEFDFDATVAAVKRELLKERRRQFMEADRARKIWDEIPTEADSRDGFIQRMMCCRSAFLNVEPWHWTKERMKPSLVGLGRNVWDPFIAHLRAEVAAESAQGTEVVA